MQLDKGAKFRATKIKKFLEEEGIIYINSSPNHPQTNVVVEAFNKNIINKLEYILIDDNNSFDLKLGLNKATEIYNNSVHTSTKIEPIKAIRLKDEKIIEQVLKNILNSQSNKLKNFESIIKKADKCLLNNIYIKKGKPLKCKFNKKGKYIIPIIIEGCTGGNNYSFKLPINLDDLKIDTIYKVDYRLIKRYSEEIWDHILKTFNKTENK